MIMKMGPDTLLLWSEIRWGEMLVGGLLV